MSVILTKRNSAGVRGYQNKCRAESKRVERERLAKAKANASWMIKLHLATVNEVFHEWR